MKLVSKFQNYPHVNAEDIDEAMLWDKFKSGDKEAYAFIYENYSDILYQYGMQLTNNCDLVEDAIQDLFVCIWRTKTNLCAVKSIKFYLITCLRREVFKKIKKDNKIYSFDIQNEEHSVTSNSIEDDMLEEEILEEKNHKVQKVFKGLSKRQREILYLKFFENHSYQQIAQILGLDLKYTYNTASKAYNILKKNIVFVLCIFSQVN